MTTEPKDLRFPKDARLRWSCQFQELWKKGRKYHTPHFIILVGLSDSEKARLGLTISRKVGNAVLRNRIKRTVREWFRHHRLQLPPVDFSVVARSKAKFERSQHWTEELDAVLKQL